VLPMSSHEALHSVVHCRTAIENPVQKTTPFLPFAIAILIYVHMSSP
jgi:hypothetical protein